MSFFEPRVVEPALGVATVVRHPVKERLTDDKGRLRQSEAAFVRTAEIMETRELRVLRIESRSRMVALFGVDEIDFSLTTGRAMRRPDWRIEKESLKRLRRLRNELFPRPKKPKTEPETSAAAFLNPEPDA